MALVVHVDTDIGGDPDDLCALAMLLGWPGVELAGATTSTDEGGMCGRGWPPTPSASPGAGTSP